MGKKIEEMLNTRIKQLWNNDCKQLNKNIQTSQKILEEKIDKLEDIVDKLQQDLILLQEQVRRL